MGDPVFKGSMELSQVMREIDRVNKELGKLKEANQAATQSAKSGASGASIAFSDWGREIMGVVSGYATLRGVMELANQEARNTIELRQKAAQATQSEADAQRDFLRNFAASSALERDAAIARVKGISSATNVPTRDLFQRASALFSAKGNLSDEAAFRALEGSARFVPESTEKGVAVGVASLDLMRATKSQNVEAALGLLAMTAKQAHVFDWQKIAENAAPALAGIMGSGGTASEAGALYAATTMGMSDWTGRKSRTAALQLARQLEEFYPERDTQTQVDPASGQVTQWGRKGTGMKTLGERLAFVQRSEKDALQFFAQANFEEQAKNTMRGMIGLKDRDSKEGMMQTYRDMLEVIPSGEAAAAHFRMQEKLIGASEGQRVTSMGRGIEAATARLLSENPALALAGTLQEKVPGLLQAAGSPAIAEKMRGFAASYAANPEAARLRLADVETELGHKLRPIDYYRPAGPYSQGRPVYRDPTAEELSQADRLKEVADGIRELIKIQNESKDAAQTTARKQGVSGAAATNTHTEGR